MEEGGWEEETQAAHFRWLRPLGLGLVVTLCLLGPPTLSRLNIGLAEGPAPRPHPVRNNYSSPIH